MRTVVLLANLIVYLTSPISGKYLRVINGTDDVNNEFPYVVSIESLISLEPGVKIYRLCTGSLIAATWVLSAGHCLTSSVKLVRYGDMTVPRNATYSISLVLQMVPHPNLVLPMSDSDISLVRNDIGLLAIEKINIGVGKISALDYKTLVGRAARFAGFGSTRPFEEATLYDEIKDNKKPLQLGGGVIVTCPKWEDMTWFPSLCTSPVCTNIDHDTASGDSGGPLILDGKIVGVIGGGLEDPKTSIFTPVSPYLKWIRQEMLRTGLSK